MKKLVLISLLSFFYLSGVSSGTDQKPLKDWICEKYQISEENCNIPDANIISIRLLRIVWLKAQDRMIERQRETYTDDEIQATIDYYLAELLGFFNPALEEIYIRNDLDHCKLASIIIHEFVHYIQHKSGRMPSSESCLDERCAIIRWMLETKAYNIQETFFKECEGII